jgi:hypothetical protein
MGQETTASTPISGVVYFTDDTRPWTILGGILIIFVLIWSILGIELTIRWNRVTAINDILSTGQLIPFIMGISSLPAALWGVVEYYQEVQQEKRVSSQEVFSKSKPYPHGFAYRYRSA